ncbi:MAG: hypothetical protein RRY55_07090 [Bacteroidales bacterium]
MIITASALANYEVLVIPQMVTMGNSLFTITLNGYSPFYYKVPAGRRLRFGLNIVIEIE